MKKLTQRHEAIIMKVISQLRNKKGIEIGGPSDVFKENATMPVYPVIASLDGCNFHEKTIWEGTIREGKTYNYFKRKKGYQYICEATDLPAIPACSYDFILASHCLEHIANPLKALKEWLRVLIKGGTLLLIVPDGRYTFDHDRPLTSLHHLMDDLKHDREENDLTHLPEILKLHDLSLDPWAGDKRAFTARSLQNHRNRCLHHHVFDPKLIKEMFKYLHMKTILIDRIFPANIIALGERGI